MKMKDRTGTARPTKWSVFVDVSGQPGVDERTVVTSVWCREENLERVGEMLQHVRDINECPYSLKFSKLHDKPRKFGGREGVSIHWLATLMNSKEFKVRSFTHSVPSAGFDIRYFKGDRDRATNWIVRLNILFALQCVARPNELVALTASVDGHSQQFHVGWGMLDYLERELVNQCRERANQPNLTSVLAAPVAREPLSSSKHERRIQDLVALADLVAGSSRVAMSETRTAKMKRQLGDLLKKGLRYEKSTPELDRKNILKTFIPPNSFFTFASFRAPSLEAQSASVN